jgi:YD repeat-containing protein
VGGTSTVSVRWIYGAYGNLGSVTFPGNAASSSITYTFNYTTDGGYGQAEAIGEPLTITDNTGKVTHIRYDTQGNVLSVTDALGNQANATYDITNNPTTITAPATGETGLGRSYSTFTYGYADGPLSSTSVYDESGNLVRTQNTSYGLDGETLSYSGSTEPTTFSYDGLLRLQSLTDGNGNATTYTYNANSYLASISFPNANATTGYDIESFPSYDAQGDLLERIDGRGVQTNYTHAGPDSTLPGISYPASPSLNATFTYDAYGRVSGTSDGATAAATGAGIVPSYDDDDDVTSVQTTYVGAAAGTYLPAALLHLKPDY